MIDWGSLIDAGRVSLSSRISQPMMVTSRIAPVMEYVIKSSVWVLKSCCVAEYILRSSRD